MSVCCRRTVAVLCLTCSWWVTTYVGKPSTTGQPTRPTQFFILLRSINWVVCCNWMSASSRVAPSGECLRGEGLVWLIGAVVCLLAAYSGSNCTLTCAVGWPQFVLQHHWLLPINCHFRDCKVRWSGHRVSKLRYIRIRPLPLSFTSSV